MSEEVGDLHSAIDKLFEQIEPHNAREVEVKLDQLLDEASAVRAIQVGEADLRNAGVRWVSLKMLCSAQKQAPLTALRLLCLALGALPIEGDSEMTLLDRFGLMESLISKVRFLAPGVETEAVVREVISLADTFLTNSEFLPRLHQIEANGRL